MTLVKELILIIFNLIGQQKNAVPQFKQYTYHVILLTAYSDNHGRVPLTVACSSTEMSMIGQFPPGWSSRATLHQAPSTECLLQYESSI